MKMLMMTNDLSLFLLLMLTAFFISTNPVHSQRRLMSKVAQGGARNNSVYKVHLYNYVVQAGTGVNLKPPIRPVPPNLRWSSYAVDKVLDPKTIAISEDYSERLGEVCRQHFKRPCIEAILINAARKSLSMSVVALEHADIIRVFQDSVGGFPNDYVHPRYYPANETAPYHQHFADNETEEAQLDRFEIKEAVDINYIIYLSVYEGHVCSFASKPKVIKHGDTLRLRCQITMNGYWVPSLYFRNEYDGSVYEANTTNCSSLTRPHRYCALVDVRVDATVLAFACHVRFPAEARFKPKLIGYNYQEAQWPNHNHHSPVCYLDKLYINTIPSDVTFLCDKMPCEETVGVDQEISCQAEAYPQPLIQLSVLIAELHTENALSEATPQGPGEEGGKEHGEGESEREEEAKKEDGRLFLDADDADEAATATTDPATPPIMETEEQQQQKTGGESDSQNASTSDGYEPEETNTTSNSSELNDVSSIAETTSEPQTSDQQTSQTHTPEVEDPESETTQVGKSEIETPETQEPEVTRPEAEEPKEGTPEVVTPEIDKPEVTTPEVDRPMEETDLEIDKRNDTADEREMEKTETTPAPPKDKKEREEKFEGSGEMQQEETEVDSRGSKDEGEEVTTFEVYKVTQEVVGKVLEVSCNISNSLGWGSNSIVLEVRAASTPQREDGSTNETTLKMDEKKWMAETPASQSDRTEDGSGDPWMVETDHPERKILKTTWDPSASSGSGEHIDDDGHKDWRKEVPAEAEGPLPPVNETTDAGSGVDETPTAGKPTETLGLESGDDAQPTRREFQELPTAPPSDRDAQMELARKYGPRDIKVYCNGAPCIGSPRMFVGDVLNCEAKGAPPLHISFIVEGSRIINSVTYQLMEEDRGSLTITCLAKNQYGSMTSRIVLTVSPKRNELVKKFRKEDGSGAGRPRPQNLSLIVGFSAFVSVAAAAGYHRLLTQLL